MLLYMDIGNSEIKWATDQELERDVMHRAVYSELATSLPPQLEAIDPPAQVHISSVIRSERLAQMCDWVSSHWDRVPVFARTRRAELGVTNGYRQPGQLGVDRWLGLLAARTYSQSTPYLMVDCGTATTLDAVDRSGQHLGGVILPGMRLFRQCLQANTDLPPLQGETMSDGFATDTAKGIAAGAMLATTAAIEAMLQQVRERCGDDVKCIVTGGAASQVVPHLKTSPILVPNLILQGLALQAGLTDRQ